MVLGVGSLLSLLRVLIFIAQVDYNPGFFFGSKTNTAGFLYVFLSFAGRLRACAVIRRAGACQTSSTVIAGLMFFEGFFFRLPRETKEGKDKAHGSKSLC